MLIGMIALLMVAQNPVPVKTAGPPVSVVPHDPVVRRTADATALGIIGAVDANQIEATTLAKTKASASEVKSYAAMLLKDHQLSLTNGTKLAKELKVTRLLPPDSVMARAHVDEMAQLNLLSGAAFDRAFVQFMVDDHKAAIAKVKTLVAGPAVRKEAKEYLSKILPAMMRHLQIGEQWLAAHP